VLWPKCNQTKCDRTNCDETHWKLSDCDWSNCDWSVCDFMGVTKIRENKKNGKTIPNVRIYLEQQFAEKFACSGTKADAIIAINDEKYLVCEIKRPIEKPDKWLYKSKGYLKKTRDHWIDRSKTDDKIACAWAIVIGGQLEATFIHSHMVQLADKVDRNTPSKIVSLNDLLKKKYITHKKRCLIFDKTQEDSVIKAFEMLFNDKFEAIQSLEKYTIDNNKLSNVHIWAFDISEDDKIKFGGWFPKPEPKIIK